MQRRQHRRAPGPKGHRRVMADLAMGLRSIIRAPSVLPRSGRSRATVTSRSPDLIMSRRGVASHRGPGGQYTNAEFIAEQHRPGAPAHLAAPSASRPPVFCSEMTFLGNCGYIQRPSSDIHPKRRRCPGTTPFSRIVQGWIGILYLQTHAGLAVITRGSAHKRLGGTMFYARALAVD
jgi:hypothetical protein